jgi:hypothetical protein
LTVVALLPKTLLTIVVLGQDIHVAPLFRLYSIAVETPVIVSVEPLYTALGAAARAGTETVSVAEAGSADVALTRK